ncbi:hypothetical protein E8E14_004367 [Neopestalotiopsis sp. 37M]|nr:hypothetical protein E8E14_004367 [Neopestalotiopsis sp. 37M]
MNSTADIIRGIPPAQPLKPGQTPIVVIVSIGAVDLLWSGYLAYWFINYNRRNVPSRTRAAITTFITSMILFLPQVLIWTFVFIASWPIAFYFFNSDRFGRSRNDFFYWRRVLGFPWEVMRSTNSCRMDY